MIKTLHLKVKKPYYAKLNALVPEVNFVWNYINGLSYYMIRNHRRWLSAYDIHKYTVGSSKEFAISASTIQKIAEQYCIRRNQYRKNRLKWRKSTGNNKSLGWIPFTTGDVFYKKGEILTYNRWKFKVFDSYGLENYKLRAGNFAQDSKGDWYLNIAVEVAPVLLDPAPTGEVGIDLGLKTFATLSNGEKVENPKFYEFLEPRIAMAQKAKKRGLRSTLAKKVKNRRKDFLHKLSNKLTKENRLIVVGNIDTQLFQRGVCSKQVNDAGWSFFKRMLEYKAIRHQAIFVCIKEYWTSLTCSVCKSRTGPQGSVGLKIREWTCSSCGASHDRDINAAKNILALGRQSLAEGAKLC